MIPEDVKAEIEQKVRDLEKSTGMTSDGPQNRLIELGEQYKERARFIIRLLARPEGAFYQGFFPEINAARVVKALAGHEAIPALLQALADQPDNRNMHVMALSTLRWIKHRSALDALFQYLDSRNPLCASDAMEYIRGIIQGNPTLLLTNQQNAILQRYSP